MKVLLFGATGYAGSHIVNELEMRGHSVVAVSRGGGSPASAHVRPLAGSIDDRDLVARAAAGCDAIVVALPFFRARNGEPLGDAFQYALGAALDNGARLGVVGGAGSLFETEQGPRHADGPNYPAFLQPVYAAHLDIRRQLAGSDTAIDWFYFSPAANFGSKRPGERTGRYRLGGMVMVRDADGVSYLSGADYGIAFVDELERPKHHRQQFTAGY
jgi:putative NADH-flavin reductase